jgi:hypothetical protein
MAIADDISIAANGDIRYTGAAHGAAGAGYYTVIEFHRFLQDKADDAVASGDDLLDITDSTPSERATDNYITLINSYNIDQTLSEHLYDGTIVQNGGNEVWDGLVVIANEGIDLQIIQAGAQLANDFWNTVPDGETEKGLNRDVANGIAQRFMLKVRDAGADIDGKRIVGTTRVVSKSYSEFKINGLARGNNVLALTYADDNNDTEDASTWTTITNTEGYRAIDVNNDTTDEYFYSEWNKDAYSMNQLYTRLKYLTRGDAANVGTLYGIDAKIFRGITHELNGTQAAGTFTEPEQISWTGGTGQLLAIDSTTAGTKIWMQILTGVAPTSGTVTGDTSSATFTVSGSSEKPISTPFCGQSTGTAIIGAYGVGIEYADLTASDLLTALDGNQYQPPNNVQFTVGGLVTGEDRVLVGPETAGGLDSGQFVLNAGITAGAASVTVTDGTELAGTGENSATDTPSTGTIRILGDDGVYHRVTYTGVTPGVDTLTFTGCTGAPDASISNNVFISYIDKLATGANESFTVVYAADRSLYIRVRDGGASPIKTFETTGTLGSGGGSTTAIRTSDA